MPIENSVLYLIKGLNLTNSYEHTIDFESKEKQDAFFDSKVSLVIPEDDYSYIRQNENIKVFVKIDDIIDFNYLFYNNGSKRHYCFITDKRYVNEETTELIIEEDVMQTYMFDYQLDECFVEREHTDRYDENKNPIFNLVEENLNYGDEYQSKSEVFHPVTFNDGTPIYFMYIFADSKITFKVDNGYFIDAGIPTGYYTYVLPIAKNKIITWSVDGVSHRMYGLAALSLDQTRASLFANEHVKEIFVSPIPPAPVLSIQDIFTFNDNVVVDFDNFLGNGDGPELPGLLCLYSRTDTNYFNWTSQSISGYPGVPSFPTEPLVTDSYTGLEPNAYKYPYSFVKLCYGGQELILKPQYRKSKATIYIYQSLSDEGTVVIDASRTNKITSDNNNEYCITNQSPAYVNLSTNAWSQYMLQNKAQRQSGFISTGIGAGLGFISGIASGNPIGFLGAAGSVISAGVKISQQLAKEKDIKNQPDDVRQFNGDISQLIATKNIDIKLRNYSIYNTFLKQIKDYFHHYGYKVNDMHIPNIKSRYNFNYIKNVDTHIICNLNNDIISKIETIYNNGITFWHYRDNNFAGIRAYNNNNYEVKLLKENKQ